MSFDISYWTRAVLAGATTSPVAARAGRNSREATGQVATALSIVFVAI